MIRFFSWLIVFAMALYAMTVLFLPFGNMELVPVFVILAFVIGVTSAVVIIALLIRERMKDREVERDDLDKY